MRCCLCVKLQPCEILPGLPEAYHPETGCRAYAEKTRPYYAIEGKTAHFIRRSGRVSCMGKGLIPNPVKMGFYCVTYNQNCTYEKTGRGGYSLAAASRLFFVFLSALCPLFPFWLFILPQNAVNVALDNVIFLDLFFQLPIVRIQSFFLCLELFIFCLQRGKVRELLYACYESFIL